MTNGHYKQEIHMQIQINYADIDSSDALSDHVTKAVENALKKVATRVTRVEVHLHDDKQNRRGPDDKRCVMEARIAGQQPLAVESRGEDIYKAVTEGAAKMGRAVEHQIERSK